MIFRRAVAILIVTLWLASLAFPVWEGSSAGWWIFLAGWAGIFFGDFSWFANYVLFGVVFLLPARRQYPRLLTGFGLLLAFTAFVGLTRTTMIDNEGGVRNAMHPELGYYLWVASITIGALAALGAGAATLRSRPVSD